MIYSGRLAPILVLSVPLSGAATVRPLLLALPSTRDQSEHGGNGRIAGTTKNLGTPDFPVWRRVRLFDFRDNRLVREVWSDPATGAYSFDYINPSRRYVVIGYDHTGQYNAVIADGLTPEVMP